MTAAQAIVLASIGDHPGSTQRALTLKSGIDRSSLNAMLKLMQQRGWLTITRSLDDERTTLIDLTSAGRAVEKHARKLLKITDVAITNRLAPQNRAKFETGLQQIVRTYLP